VRSVQEGKTVTYVSSIKCNPCFRLHSFWPTILAWFFIDEGGPFDGSHFSETEKGGVPMA